MLIEVVSQRDCGMLIPYKLYDSPEYELPSELPEEYVLILNSLRSVRFQHMPEHIEQERQAKEKI